MSEPTPSDYSADDVLAAIDWADRHPADDYSRAVALALLVIGTRLDAILGIYEQTEAVR